jgi:hypothetical protein
VSCGGSPCLALWHALLATVLTHVLALNRGASPLPGAIPSEVDPARQGEALRRDAD